MVFSFQWQQVTWTNIHISHMLVCMIPDMKLFLFLILDPIPPPPFPFHSSCLFPLVSHCLLLAFSRKQEGEIVCEYQYSRLCTLAVPLDRWSSHPFLMFTFVRFSRADWFQGWPRADERKRKGRKCVLECESESSKPLWNCRVLFDL